MQITVEKQEFDTAERHFHHLRLQSAVLRNESLHFRKARLRALLDWIMSHRQEIKDALYQDFRKPFTETDISEIYPVIGEIRHTIGHLEQWAKPKKVDATLPYLGTWSQIVYEPKGVCLILAPWNFPFNLCVGPLISCLAAGNTALVKPSELTPATSALIKRMLEETFGDNTAIAVEGGPDLSAYLTSLPFDHIFFTGSPGVGKKVMAAAAQNLASVTLELGGKSPVVVDRSANIKDAAKRITFGKFLNNGQTCIAPDYLLVHDDIVDELIDQLKVQVSRLFGNAGKVDESSPSYGRIVNKRHFERINSLIQDAIDLGATPVMTGQVSARDNFIPPTILTKVPANARIMEEEIFGPVLPVITFSDSTEAVEFINSKPKPLALYLFGNKAFRKPLLKTISAGSVCINDCITQFTHPNLPFGGVNNSGIGKAHGQYGFLAFSNEKSVLSAKKGFSLAYVFHPPYTPGMQRIVNFILKWF